MDAEARSRVCVVLVRARNPNNIGAVARAMHGFGFADLRLVNEYPVALERARSAVDASAILAEAREFATVADAVADCRLVVGTTAVGKRTLDQPVFTVAQLSEKIEQAGRVALLFGSEKTGLSNEALSHCHWLATIPMHATPQMRHASMNLGQAAAVFLYELVRQNKASPLTSAPLAASAADLERLTGLWLEILEDIGYARRRPASAEPAEVRRMVRRMELSQSDARRWIGILRQVLWKLKPSE